MARVRKAADELGYRQERNDLARRLALRRTGEKLANRVLGLVMPGHLETTAFFFDLFRGISAAASDAGYGMLVVPSYDLAKHESRPIELPPCVLRGEVDGLIVLHGFARELLQHLRQESDFGDRPIVSVLGQLDGCPAVLRDECEGARLAMAHLLSLGHRRILYFNKNASQYPEAEHKAGYRQACTAAGVDLDACLIPIPITHDHLAKEPFLLALRQHPDATALLAHNDPIAHLACYAAQEEGLRVPEDLSVVGWDDTDPLPGPDGGNRLTSIAYDIRAMGQAAARWVIETTEGGREGERLTLMPPTLVKRASTTCPARTGRSPGRQ